MWSLSARRPRRKIALKAKPRPKQLLLLKGIKIWLVNERHLYTRSKARIQLSPRRLVRSRRRNKDNYSIRWDKAVLGIEDLRVNDLIISNVLLANITALHEGILIQFIDELQWRPSLSLCHAFKINFPTAWSQKLPASA
jgi:hypothetical protein